MKKTNIELIRKFGEAVLENAGLSNKDAAVSMDCLLLADLRGVRTHGITHLKGYCDRLEFGASTAGHDMEYIETSDTTLVVDAKHAVGMPSVMEIMERCMEKAKVSGSCIASVKNGSHYGIGAYSPMKAAERGMIGFCISNTVALVAPFGGADALLGTNPISFAVPAGKYPTMVLDMATSLVAKGKISLAIKEGKSIPEGWALDQDGNPTTDPLAANIGALLPVGGPKGYGLALLVTLLTSCLSGADIDGDISRTWEEPEKQTNIGFFLGAIDIEKFCPLEVFKSRVDAFFDVLKNSRPAVGFERVMIPGEIEHEMTQRGISEGIELSDATLNDFKALSEKYKVNFEFE